MRRYVFRLTFLALAALGTSVVLGNDQQIAQTIVEKLTAEKKAGNLKGFNIDLNVEEGTVWMSGRVSSADQQARALDIARRIPGVKQVVNDLSVEKVAAKKAPSQTAKAPEKGMMSSFTSAVKHAVAREVGTGVTPAPAQLQEVPVPPAPVPVPVAPAAIAPQQQQLAALPQYAQPQYAQPYYAARPSSQVPLAYAPARTIGYYQGVEGGPVAAGPTAIPGTNVGMAVARYDHPHMPGYAWPSYASHPNYAAVTYPKQYSPTAWPYIGPFYPYPQVPLGWRKVTLEWDDGWWMLDFKDRRH